MDEKIKQLVQELGIALNESISGSENVNRHIQRIRDEGYDLYVVLDATIGLNRQDGSEAESFTEGSMAPAQSSQDLGLPVYPESAKGSYFTEPSKDVGFRINVQDLAMLRALGIDPTRKVKTARRVEPLRKTNKD